MFKPKAERGDILVLEVVMTIKNLLLRMIRLNFVFEVIMSTQAVSYRGPLQTFTFEENSKRTEVIDHADQTVRVLSAQFPVYPEDLKDGASVMVLKRMFGNGFYPYVSDGVVKFGEGLPGGMLRSGSAAAAAAATPADPYIPRDWSQPVEKIAEFETSCRRLIGLPHNRFATLEKDKDLVLWNRDGRLKTISHVGDYDVEEHMFSSRTDMLELYTFPGERLAVLERDSVDALDGYIFQLRYPVFNLDGKEEGCGPRERDIHFYCGLDNASHSVDTDIWSTSLKKQHKDFNGLCIALQDSREWVVLHRSREEYTIWSIEGACKKTIKIQVDQEEKLRDMDVFMRLRNKDFLCAGYGKIIIFNQEGKILQRIESSRLLDVCELNDGTIAGISEGSLKIWRRNGECISTLASGSATSFLELKDGNLALACSNEGTGFIQIYNREGQCINKFSIGEFEILEIIQFEDGVLAIHPQEGPVLSIWEPKALETDARNTKELEVHFQKQLAELMQTTQASIREMQARYEVEGRARFEQMMREQEEAFQACLKASTATLAGDWATSHAGFYQQAFQEVNKGAVLRDLSDAHLKKIRDELSQVVGSRLQGELQSLMGSHSYQRQIQELQQTVLDEITKRQGQLIQEMIHTQKQQASLHDRQDVLWQKYETKQKKLQEQQSLQNPPSVRAFYNATEKHFSAHLMSAMMLVSGMVTRTETRLEVGAKAGSKVAEMLCGAIPLVGNVAGSLISFGIEAGAGYVADRKAESAHKSTFDSAVRFKDAMALAELAARRVAQGFLSHLQSLTLEDAKAGGEKAAQIMYAYMQEGHLQSLAGRPVEEKIAALVKAVADQSQRTKGFLGKKKGGVFDQPVEMAPGATRHVDEVRQDVKGLRQKFELAQKHQQVTATLIRSIAKKDEQDRALATLKVKGNFSGTAFTISIEKKEVKIGCRDTDKLRKIAACLTSTFHSFVVDDCDIEGTSLTVTARTSISAKELKIVLEQWLKIEPSH